MRKERIHHEKQHSTPHFPPSNCMSRALPLSIDECRDITNIPRGEGERKKRSSTAPSAAAASSPSLTVSHFRSTLLILCVIFLWFADSTTAVGPPTNPLNLFTRYEVSWLNPTTGEFGGNFTFFRSTTATPVVGWGLMFKFTSPKTIIANFNGQDQWTIARDGSAMMLAMNKDESLTNAFIPPDLVASDAAKSLKRYNLFFNGRVSAPAALKDLLPLNYSLLVAGQSKPFILVDQKDFVNTAVRSNAPRAPFGPFASNGNGAALTAASNLEVDTDIPSPNGTTLTAPPIGLGIFLGYLVFGGGFFALGTFERFKFAKEFREQRGTPATTSGGVEGYGNQVAVASSSKNQFSLT